MSSSRIDDAPASTFFDEGAELAGYRIVGPRSRGAMGVVYEAVESATGRRVCVKVLRARALHHAQTFAREREALAALSHPNIVAYVGSGETGAGVPYLVTEWLEGEDLEATLARGKLPTDLAVAIGIAVARALGAAHARGIVHRDVKPANIHLGARGEIKLLDFGVAQLASRPNSGMSVGTALYMAPEQVRAAASVDARADVYALGAVLFECLAGRPPFEGERTTVVLARTIFEPAPRLSHAGASVPAALENAIARMLAKPPDDRPSTGDAAAELLAAVGSAVDTLPIEPAPDDEQRIGCVGLVSIRVPGEGHAVTMIDGEAPALVARLSAIANEFGVALDGLFDGTFLVTAPDVLAADQAARIARFAIATVDAATTTPPTAALATGTLGGSTSSAIERAEELLRRTEPGNARVCAATASLLEGRLVLHGDALSLPGGASLVPDVPREALVGREDLVRAIVDRPRSVLVTGEAGIGKTCILHEVTDRLARTREVVVLRGELHRAGSPLAPFAIWLRRRFELAGDANDAAILRRELTTLLGDDARDLPAILRVAGVEAEGGGEGIEESIAALFVADARARGTIVVVDDAQWLDAASARVIDRARAAIVILAFGRAEVEAMLPSFTERIPVGALADRDARTLAGAAGLDQAAVDRILDRAQGHPFVIRELARAASEGPQSSVPDTVLGIVQARIARLPDAARRVARVAALFGASFTVVAACRLARVSEAAVRDALEVLVRARVVEPGPNDALAFTTPLLRDAAYELLTEEDRVVAHAAAARWFDERPERDPALVAWHAERGRESELAARAYAEAAERALTLTEVPLAITHARRGVACGAAGELLGRLRVVEAEALAWAHELGEAGARAKEAQALLAPGTERWIAAVHVESRVAARRADHDSLIELFDRVVAVTPADPGASRRQIRCALSIASWLDNLGRAPDGDRLYAEIQARNLLARPEAAHEQCAVLEYIAKSAEHRNEWTLAITTRRRVAAIHLGNGDRSAAILANLNAGGGLGELGDLDDAIATLGEVIRESVVRGVGYGASYARYLRGRALRRAGRIEEADEELTASLGEARDDVRLRGECHGELARLAIAAGDLDEARERADLALEHGETVATVYSQALAVRAEVALLEDGPAVAKPWSDKAMEVLARELGDDPSYVWRVHLEIAIALGDPALPSIARAARDHVVARARLAGEDDAVQRRFLALDDNAKILEHARELGAEQG